MLRTSSVLSTTIVACLVLAGCGGGGPPAAEVESKITEAVLTANTAMFEGGKDAADVVKIAVADWKTEPMPNGATAYEAAWTARLRFKEPLACILAEVDGKNVVKVVADKGDELPFEGRCGGTHWEGKWQMFASAGSGNDLMGPGAWKPLHEKVPDLKMGYPVYANGSQGSPRFRARNFEPLSKLAPSVVEGSPEHEKLDALARERFQKVQAAAAEQTRQRQEKLAAEQKKAQEEQARLQAEAAEKQRLAQQEAQQKQAEAAERARVAAAEAKKKTEAERHARLLAVMKPFQDKAAVVTAEAGPTLGTLILDAAIDEAKLAVSGRAVDLREMPFAEFAFAGAVDERGTFSCKPTRGGDAVAFTIAGDKLASRAGFTITALAEAERARMQTLLELGKRLGAAAPATLGVETLDADAAKTREPQLKLTGLTGAVFHRGRLAPTVAPLFTADLGANKTYAWKNKEVVALRLAEPAKGAGLYIRGTAAPSTELVVTVNGVHQATIASIPKLGGVVLGFPPELEVLDIRLEATGAVSARTIGLLK